MDDEMQKVATGWLNEQGLEILEMDPQEAIDWEVFSTVFRRREKFSPVRGDSRANDLFFYFTAGAHQEYIGKLTPAPTQRRTKGTDV